MKRILMPMAIALLLSACGGPTFDGSSPEKAQKSVLDMSEDLSEEKKMQFTMAFASLNSSRAKSLMGGPLTMTKMQESANKFLEQLDGKSVDDIIEMAEDLKDNK